MARRRGGRALPREIPASLLDPGGLPRRIDTRLCHTDLYLENVLLRREGSGWRFAALLDIEHGCATDPAEDFVKLRWWSFEPRPELRVAFTRGYGDPAPHGADFERRVELFCLYAIVASLAYFRRRSTEADPIRPWRGPDDERQLGIFRGRFARRRAEGIAC